MVNVMMGAKTSLVVHPRPFRLAKVFATSIRHAAVVPVDTAAVAAPWGVVRACACSVALGGVHQHAVHALKVGTVIVTAADVVAIRPLQLAQMAAKTDTQHAYWVGTVAAIPGLYVLQGTIVQTVQRRQFLAR